MAEDLADRLDDIICSFDKVIPGNFEGVILTLGVWALAGAIVYCISVFVSNSVKEENEKKLIQNKKQNGDMSQSPIVAKDEQRKKEKEEDLMKETELQPRERPKADHMVEQRGEVIEELIIPAKAYVCGSKKIDNPTNGIIPYSTTKADLFVGEIEEDIILPSFAYKCGDDSIPPPLTMVQIKKAVEWVNSCFERLCEAFTLDLLKQNWIENLNDYIKSLEDKVSVIVTDIVRSTHENKCPIFSNIVSQTQQRDNITVTADINATLILKLSVSESHSHPRKYYTFNITKLRGRLSISILNCDRIVIIKLDGWPEIQTELDGHDDSHPFVSDIVVSALRGTTMTLDMDDFLEGTIFPVFSRDKNIQTDENPPNSLFQSGNTFFIKNKSKDGRKGINSRALSVLVVKASGLSTTCHPFVILELDEPSQKFKTGLNQSLMWNEDFTLHLSPLSKEILFEVWDIVEGEEQFLGLGIVAIDELLISPSQRHVIPLQGRPFASRNDTHNGLLTIQFILSELNKDVALNRSFEQAAVSLNQSSLLGVNEHKTILKITKRDGLNAPCEDSEGSEMSMGKRDESPLTRSRNRKKRKLVSTLKKRITGRSFSIGSFGDSRDTSSARAKQDALEQSRSISVDRAYSLSNVNVLDGKSNLGKIQAISTGTFISEESSLVMEVDENNIKKYYLIPAEIAAKEKISMKGTKLHIFMDHIFVAKHIKRGKMCEVCSSNIPFRLRKQGYICRDCQIVCHKPCHIQVATHCLESSLPAMDILHIKKDL
ncbi:unnamed protein product [Lepeophtheirus salmonis]|uniref:(salmon louse) hypothetical protein n=1 Tax=Lepeophtheirus salmonis TaxID=72036 RepID=A0A7R8H5E8_LEPSM|nr:unnamed protein product [Lepeophtheirus salmonis]CAF2877489.1 unnamed protein product [Lepeophtheirus salmonis]